MTHWRATTPLLIALLLPPLLQLAAQEPLRSAWNEFPARTSEIEDLSFGRSRSGEPDREPDWDGAESEVDSAREEEGEEIETDRDSFTPSTTTAGSGRWIIESAYTFLDNRDVPDTHSFPEVIGRIGIDDWIELRIGWNYEVGGAANSASGGTADVGGLESGTLEREGQVSYGMKMLLTDQQASTPRSAIIVQAGTPVTGPETATQLVTTYAFGWQLPDKSRWDTAIRYAYDSEHGDHFNAWAPSTVLKVPLDERWNVHAEYFGIMSDGREHEYVRQYFSPGIHCLLHPDYELGVRVGWGLNDQSARFFVNAGFGCRY